MKIKDLQETLKLFNNKNVIVEIDDLLSVKYNIHNCEANYNNNTGYLTFKDNYTCNEFKVNIGIITSIDLIDSCLYIKTDLTDIKISQ